MPTIREDFLHGLHIGCRIFIPLAAAVVALVILR